MSAGLAPDWQRGAEAGETAHAPGSCQQQAGHACSLQGPSSNPTPPLLLLPCRTADGKVFKVSKGAPHIILKLLNAEKEAQVIHAAEMQVSKLGMRGIRALAVARQDEGQEWRMLGLLTFLDPPRPDTKDTIHKAMAYGVDVKMITGDHVLIAKETARMLGMGTNIKDAKGLPSMDADGKIPKDLGKNFGQLILEADGFGQVREGGGEEWDWIWCWGPDRPGLSQMYWRISMPLEHINVRTP